MYSLGYGTGPAAQTALTRAFALDSTLARSIGPWATLGFVRASRAWDWDGAEAAFARARTLDPDDVTTRQRLASLRMVQRWLLEAESALRRAPALRPDYADLHADLCEALYYRRAWEEADAACARALALDPEDPMARARRLWIEIAAPGGQAVARRELAANRGGPPYDVGLARLHARLGQRHSALAHVEGAVPARVFLAAFLRPAPPLRLRTR